MKNLSLFMDRKIIISKDVYNFTQIRNNNITLVAKLGEENDLDLWKEGTLEGENETGDQRPKVLKGEGGRNPKCWLDTRVGTRRSQEIGIGR